MIFLGIHVTLSSIMDAIWMKNCNEIMMSSLLLQQFATSNIGKICHVLCWVNYDHHSWTSLSFSWFGNPLSPHLFPPFFSIINYFQRNLITCKSPPPPPTMKYNALHFMELSNPLPSQCIALSLLSCLHLNPLFYLSCLSSWFWNLNPLMLSPSTSCYSNLVYCNLVATCSFYYIQTLSPALASF
jgi:hypothetical protein